MAKADASGLPIACWIESASPHEVTLVEKTIDHIFTRNLFEEISVIESDKLDEQLRKRKIKMIAPGRGRKKHTGRQRVAKIQTQMEGRNLPGSRIFVEYSIDSRDTGKTIFRLSG